jgi:diguanylate cyclase
MKYLENPSQSAEYLRKAIPLMVQYSIPPNPLNYALWYTYVSEKLPALNKQLDQTLVTYGTCPTIMSEQLFRQHVINEEVEHSEKMQAEMIKLASGMVVRTQSAAKETADFSDVLEESLVAIKDPSQQASLDDVIQKLATHTTHISRQTEQFQKELQASQAEIEKLKEELQKSRQDASVDPLTGLFNRRIFDTELTQRIKANPENETVLMMVDVDHFKKFNDEYGHLMGDKVLQYVGKLLKDECKEPMLPVRFGGEEFAVLMTGQTLEQSMGIAESIRQKIEAIRIKQKKSGKVISSITASFGITSLMPDEDSQGFIDRTDQALYMAKDQGRNCVVAV